MISLPLVAAGIGGALRWIGLLTAYGACCYLAGLYRGFRQGRERERMEVPRHGAMHFRDGQIRELRASNPHAAIDRLLSGQERLPSLDLWT